MRYEHDDEVNKTRKTSRFPRVFAPSVFRTPGRTRKKGGQLTAKCFKMPNQLRYYSFVPDDFTRPRQSSGATPASMRTL